MSIFSFSSFAHADKQAQIRDETWGDVYVKPSISLVSVLIPRIGISTYYTDRFKISLEYGELKYKSNENFGLIQDLEIEITHISTKLNYYFVPRASRLTRYNVIDRLSDIWYLTIGTTKKSFLTKVTVSVDKKNASPFSNSETVTGFYFAETILYEYGAGFQLHFPYQMFLAVEYNAINILYTPESEYWLEPSSSKDTYTETREDRERRINSLKKSINQLQQLDYIAIAFGFYF